MSSLAKVVSAMEEGVGKPSFPVASHQLTPFFRPTKLLLVLHAFLVVSRVFFFSRGGSPRAHLLQRASFPFSVKFPLAGSTYGLQFS